MVLVILVDAKRSQRYGRINIIHPYSSIRVQVLRKFNNLNVYI